MLGSHLIEKFWKTTSALIPHSEPKRTTWEEESAGCRLRLELDQTGTSFKCGSRLTGMIQLSVAEPRVVEEIRLSLIANGKASNEPLANETVLEEDYPDLPTLQPDGGFEYQFSLILPNKPVSYEGELFSISWFLVVEVQFEESIELKVSRPFRLVHRDEKPMNVHEDHSTMGYRPKVRRRRKPENEKSLSLKEKRSLIAVGVAALACIGTMFISTLYLWIGGIGLGILALGTAGWWGYRQRRPYAAKEQFEQIEVGLGTIDNPRRVFRPGEGIPCWVRLQPSKRAIYLKRVTAKLIAQEKLNFQTADVSGTGSWENGAPASVSSETPPTGEMLTAVKSKQSVKEQVADARITRSLTTFEREQLLCTSQTIGPQDIVDLDDRIRLPFDAPVSVHLGPCQLQWYLQVEIAITGKQPWKQLLPFEVEPLPPLTDELEEKMAPIPESRKVEVDLDTW
ncbi:Hypothetical protein PBC10988_17660 [Planctomycetales bacterium 10988]|nr:Hypothetical protein PBC10988_17660 [Planctomycetales bacterium 10988]